MGVISICDTTSFFEMMKVNIWLKWVWEVRWSKKWRQSTWKLFQRILLWRKHKWGSSYRETEDQERWPLDGRNSTVCWYEHCGTEVMTSAGGGRERTSGIGRKCWDLARLCNRRSNGREGRILHTEIVRCVNEAVAIYRNCHLSTSVSVFQWNMAQGHQMRSRMGEEMLEALK